MLSSFMYRDCLLRVVTVGQSDSPESSHPPAVRKLSTPSDAHALVGNVDSHVRWKLFLLCLIFEVNHFIRQKQAFNSTRKFIGGMLPRHESEKIPKLTRSWFPVSWNRKVAPVLEFPIPAERSTLLAIVVEWKLVFVWFVTWNYASDCIVQVHVSSTVHKWRIW